mmetsp:Transcript_8861/g.27451  ORF Transcript_8861/g.27451 Transcript_8861/m.27451 type:complete len:226 (-) Transcript_8861:164-841(-)
MGTTASNPAQECFDEYNEATRDLPFKHLFKFTMVGPARAGKSHLLARLAQLRHRPESDSELAERPSSPEEHDYSSTIGMEFSTCIVLPETSHSCKLQVWEIASSFQRSDSALSYLSPTYNTLIVFDLTCRESLAHVTDVLLPYLRQSNSIVVSNAVLIGNKPDLHAKSAVTPEEANEMAQELAGYYEVCAADLSSTRALFSELARRVLRKNGVEVDSLVKAARTG